MNYCHLDDNYPLRTWYEKPAPTPRRPPTPEEKSRARAQGRSARQARKRNRR